MSEGNSMDTKKVTILVLAGCLLFGPDLLADTEGIRLQALQATSGDRVESLLDGEAATGWQAPGDPRLEGVLFRFEAPTEVSSVKVTACDNSPAFGLIPFVNSVRGRLRQVKGPTWIVPAGKKSISLRSLFLRFAYAKPGACIGEVVFYSGDHKLDVLPPRRVRASVKVSSTLKPEAAYHKSYLFDQSVDYGWVEGAAGLGKGEKIVIEFQQPHEISGIQIYNGYQRSRDHFYKNARVGKLKISADGHKAQVFSVPDMMGPSMIGWKSGGKIKNLVLQIEGARPGTKYKDLVISELRFMDEDGFFSIETGDDQGLSEGLTKELKGKPLSTLLDRSLESYCRLSSMSVNMAEDVKLSDFGFRKLKFRSNYRFVYYSQIAVGDEANIVSESIEGIWVPDLKKTKGPWSKVRLYARGQHIGQDIDESYEVITKNTRTRIIGGSLQVASVKALGRRRFLELVRKWDKSPASFKVQCGTNRMSYFSNSVVKKKNRENDKIFRKFYNDLVKKKAVVVQGRAITDLFF